ncbi:MAG: dihydrolipoamide acetyltransferase family protein [Dehalococcoidia bacterium]
MPEHAPERSSETTDPIVMPQLGESAVEGTIVRWLKRPGETVARDEPIVEVMTEKVNVDLPAPIAGRLVRWLAQEGDTVPIGAPIAEIDREVGERSGARLSPAVRHLAREHGIALGGLPGSGLGGRVTRQDVLAAIEQRTVAPAVSASPLRRSIAEHLTRAHRETPSAWTMQEADVTGLVQLREAVKAAFLAREGVGLTYLPFVLRAALDALDETPALNGRWDGDRVVLHDRVNLGIAVALEDGLIVPVIHDAGARDLADLARAAADLAGRARAGALTPVDVQGGTFTVNNTGAFGSILSAPIVNHPEAGIMTMEAIVKRPMVLDDETIAVRSMMNICLTFDHRVIDGATAGRFLSAVKRRLEAYSPDSTPLGGSDASTS